MDRLRQHAAVHEEWKSEYEALGVTLRRSDGGGSESGGICGGGARDDDATSAPNVRFAAENAVMRSLVLDAPRVQQQDVHHLSALCAVSTALPHLSLSGSKRGDGCAINYSATATTASNPAHSFRDSFGAKSMGDATDETGSLSSSLSEYCEWACETVSLPRLSSSSLGLRLKSFVTLRTPLQTMCKAIDVLHSHPRTTFVCSATSFKIAVYTETDSQFASLWLRLFETDDEHSVVVEFQHLGGAREAFSSLHQHCVQGFGPDYVHSGCADKFLAQISVPISPPRQSSSLSSAGDIGDIAMPSFARPCLMRSVTLPLDLSAEYLVDLADEASHLHCVSVQLPALHKLCRLLDSAAAVHLALGSTVVWHKLVSTVGDILRTVSQQGALLAGDDAVEHEANKRRLHGAVPRLNVQLRDAGNAACSGLALLRKLWTVSRESSQARASLLDRCEQPLVQMLLTTAAHPLVASGERGDVERMDLTSSSDFDCPLSPALEGLSFKRKRAAGSVDSENEMMDAARSMGVQRMLLDVLVHIAETHEAMLREHTEFLLSLQRQYAVCRDERLGSLTGNILARAQTAS